MKALYSFHCWQDLMWELSIMSALPMDSLRHEGTGLSLSCTLSVVSKESRMVWLTPLTSLLAFRVASAPKTACTSSPLCMI